MQDTACNGNHNAGYRGLGYSTEDTGYRGCRIHFLNTLYLDTGYKLQDTTVFARILYCNQS